MFQLENHIDDRPHGVASGMPVWRRSKSAAPAWMFALGALLAGGCGDKLAAAPDAAPAPAPVDAGRGDTAGTLRVLAGNTTTGFADGPGEAARFNGPAGAALSPNGRYIYVSDTFNDLIRRIDVSTGAVTTLAGRPQADLSGDGIGVGALFEGPRAIAVTPDGSALYVADGPALRRMALDTNLVTTVAGVPYQPGYQDGAGDAVRFGSLIHSMAFSADGSTLYIADRSNEVVRAFDVATGEVTSVAGAPYDDGAGHVDGIGAAARFSGLGGLVRGDGALYIADTFNHCIRRLDPLSGEVTTIAGMPGTGGTADGAGAAASFTLPQALAGDATHLYVVGFSASLRRVRVSDALVETLLGVDGENIPIDGERDRARLGVAFGPPLLDLTAGEAGVLYYSDRDASSFRNIDLASLRVDTLAGARMPRGAVDGPAAEARFHDPADIVCTRAGDVCYVSDAGNHLLRVLRREPDTVSTLAGLAGTPGAADGDARQARFSAPAGLALDESGRILYVADADNHTIRAVRLADGAVITVAGTAGTLGADDAAGVAARFQRPDGLVLSADARILYVADRGNGTVRAIALQSGAVTTLAGAAGERGGDDGQGTAARFRSPAGLALSADGAVLYVADADFQAHTIRAIDTRSGAVTTLAGRDGESGADDGTLADARFQRPGDLLLDASGGALYVMDTGNHVVRYIDLGAGTASTWLGDPRANGHPPPGIRVAWDDATLHAPVAMAPAGDGFVVLGEDAVLFAHPPRVTAP